MAASTLSVRSAVCRAQRAAPVARAAGPRAPFLGRPQRLPLRQVERSVPSTVVRAETEKTDVDVDAIVKDLQEKWDGVENKSAVAIYAGGAVVLLWLSSTIVSAVNAVPLLPKLLELVGLGYTAWFVYRYLLFKSSREELLEDIEELKKKVTGSLE
ncbi:Protein CURVATURE THYLAKOID 1A, chloroplastic [Coccomyxa sp. Obi]|nr:Protein CURVATURE THYLAKOID 1A, chloroplastic [Coccomyxa sp. Obi]